MTERINLPTDSWLLSEVFEDEIMTDHHIGNHVFISWASFIMHGPTTVDQLKLAISNQPFNLFFLSIRLQIPPHGKEFHFNFRKLLLWIIKQRINNRAKLNSDKSILYILPASIKVLIYSF